MTHSAQLATLGNTTRSLWEVQVTSISAFQMIVYSLFTRSLTYDIRIMGVQAASYPRPFVSLSQPQVAGISPLQALTLSERSGLFERFNVSSSQQEMPGEGQSPSPGTPPPF